MKKNSLCSCPITIEGQVERAAKYPGPNGFKIAPELVPALVRNLLAAGFTKGEIRRRAKLVSRSTTRPTVTETRPLKDWIQVRDGHLEPLFQHAASGTCPEGVTVRDVALAFWAHGTAVTTGFRRIQVGSFPVNGNNAPIYDLRPESSPIPTSSLVRVLVAKTRKYGEPALAEWFKATSAAFGAL